MKLKYVLGLVPILFILLSQVVYAQWWDVNWRYRIPINITERSGNNLTDFQVNITIVDVLPLIYSGKMRPDLGDIRFTYVYPNGTEVKIPYWIESYPINWSGNAVYKIGTTCIPLNDSGWSYFDSLLSGATNYGTNRWNSYDPWSCDNCDMYIEINLTLIGTFNSVQIWIGSDDGHALWVNGKYVGSCGGSGGNICHVGGTCSRT